MNQEIFLDAPNVGTIEKEYLNDIIDRGFVSTVGPDVTKFEDVFTKYIGCKGAVSTQSGTAALHLALLELGIGPGDEVILPILTFIASANPVSYVGAKPVFVDVDLKTWTISPEEIEKAITPKTKAIMPVHLYGNPCKMDAIREIADKHNLFVIEDATESLGARYQGQLTGSFGHINCFSFNGNKVITTGGGGMLTSNNEKQLDHLKFISHQAKDKKNKFFHAEIGFNYGMSNVEAALGLAQMERLNDFLKQKRMFNDLYRKALSGIKGVEFQQEYEGAESTCWLTTFMINDGDLASIQKELMDRGVPTRRVFMPINEFPPYKELANGSYPNAEQIYNTGLCLPSSTLNSLESIQYVCQNVKEVLS